jgi:hypothetical protein
MATQDRFWAKVRKTDDCWIWTGAALKSGSGAFRGDGGRNIPAHRYAYLLSGRAIPGKARLIHECGNPLCVRPEHMFLGTPTNVLARSSAPGPGGCINWCERKTANGYGLLTVPGHKQILAHRLAFMLAHGDVPAGKCVLHKCDNPACVNPDHLFLGTKGDNNADRHAKGRTARGEKIAAKVRGELNYAARLTESDVRDIRRLAESGLSHGRLARRYRVDQSHITNIVNRKAWAHIP